MMSESALGNCASSAMLTPNGTGTCLFTVSAMQCTDSRHADATVSTLTRYFLLFVLVMLASAFPFLCCDKLSHLGLVLFNLSLVDFTNLSHDIIEGNDVGPRLFFQQVEEE